MEYWAKQEYEEMIAREAERTRDVDGEHGVDRSFESTVHGSDFGNGGTQRNGMLLRLGGMMRSLRRHWT